MAAYRTITTTDELRELLADDDRHTVLRDKGGYVWDSYYSHAGRAYIGCAGPHNSYERGQTILGWMNVMTPDQMVGYGPFTVIFDSNKESDEAADDSRL